MLESLDFCRQDTTLDNSMFEWIVTQVGLAGLAAFAIWIMRIWHEESIKRHNEYLEKEIQRGKEMLEHERESAAIHRDDKHLLVDVVSKNADTSSRLVEVITRIDRHIDSLNRRVDAAADKGT